MTVAADALHEEAKRIRRKANQQATAHSWLRDRYERKHAAMTVVSLVSGVFLVAMVMATPDYVEATLGLPAIYHQLVMAVLAAGTFSITVVQVALRPDSRATLHDQAVRHYTKTVYECNVFENDDSPEEARLQEIRDAYLDVRDLPRIPEREFLKLKQWHLQKVAQSKTLDQDPFASPPKKGRLK